VICRVNKKVLCTDSIAMNCRLLTRAVKVLSLKTRQMWRNMKCLTLTMRNEPVWL